MEWLSKNDLRILSGLCKHQHDTAEEIVESEQASYLERALAHHESEYMEYLLRKLERIADSSARRIEITI